jgi:hypothetical protein
VSLSSVSVDFLSYSLSSVFFSSGYLPLFSLFFRFFPLFSFLLPRPVLFSAFLGSIYRAKGVAFSHGEQPAGRPLGATAKVRLHPVFWQVRGRPVCSVGGLQARREAKFKPKPLFSFFTAAMFGGGRRKRNSVIQNDTVLLFPFFFF